uniref:C-type lectin domain-containing protein n=1 Tax=Acrobeloides nanus TaxID=290746 RepID=A0A914CPU0_9BILA
MFTSLLFLLSIFSLISSTFAACPNWTTPFTTSNKCYYFNSLGNSSDWYDAEAACNCIGGHLATIDNAFENRFVYENLRGNQSWVGAIQGTNGTWIWSEGRPVNYNSWTAGQQNGSCAYVNNGGWYSDDCQQGQYAFICQIPNAGLYCPRPKFIVNTTNYWTYFDSVNACYQIYDATTFDAASFQCDTYLSVHSAQEMTILGDYATSTSGSGDIWVGLFDPYQNGSWQWLDGSPVNFTYWDAGEPSLVGTNDCAIFSAQSYKWVSTPCVSQAMGICKTPGKLQTDQSYPQVCDGSNSFSKRGKMNADNRSKNQMKISKDARNRI